jgi:hypothetical protein
MYLAVATYLHAFRRREARKLFQNGQGGNFAPALQTVCTYLFMYENPLNKLPSGSNTEVPIPQVFFIPDP